MALDPLLQTVAKQGNDAELLEGMANVTWVDDVVFEGVDEHAEQTSGETKDSKNKLQRDSGQFDDELRLNQLNDMINGTKSGSKGVEDVRKRDSYRQIQSRALNKQMQDDLVSNKEEGDRIGKQAPTWVVAEMQT